MNYREIIANKRRKLGFSQNKLAKMVGITQQFMAEIENGRKKPSVEVLIKLCEVLNIEMMVDKD